MSMRRSWILSGLATVLALAVGSFTWGQGYSYPAAPQAAAPGYGVPPAAPANYSMPPGPAMPGPYAQAAPAGYPMPGPAAGAMMGPMPSPYGPPMAPGVYPASSMMGPGMAGGAPMMPMEAGACPHCGGMGCQFCMGDPAAEDFDVRILRWLLPYGEGGIAEPRWYDIYADFVYLTREDVSRQVDFMSQGIAGPVVLSSDSVDFDEEPGFRVGAQIQIGAGNSLEAHYMGTVHWAVSAQVNDAGAGLFSAMSDFGIAPPGGFQDTDQATFASINYASTFDTLELNYRQRWRAPNARVQGSWLMGARYFQLEEGLGHITTTASGAMNYQVDTYNAMTGFQVGGDMWITIIPGLRLGAEIKAGLYGNRAKQHTIIRAASIANPVRENMKLNSAAFLSEASLQAIWRVSHRWTFRAGYEFMYIDSVALAIENFNNGPPFVAGQRTPFINSNGDLFYHGGYAGFEWMW